MDGLTALILRRKGVIQKACPRGGGGQSSKAAGAGARSVREHDKGLITPLADFFNNLYFLTQLRTL